MTRSFGCILLSARRTVLLVQGRSTGKWSFPKGHPYTNEYPHECALRETFEETGINLHHGFTTKLHLSKGTYFVYHITKEYTPSPQDTNEIMNAKWAAIDEIPSMSCNIDVNDYYRRYGNPSTPIKKKSQYPSSSCRLPLPFVMLSV